MPKLNEDYANYLFDAIVSVENREECRRFFLDLLTYQELESMAQRLQVALMLDEGKSYLEVNKETGVSTATIGRVSRSLQYGQGGYKTVLDRLKK